MRRRAARLRHAALLQHQERLAHGVEHVRVITLPAEHAQGVGHEIRVAGELLVDLHLVAEGDHGRFTGIRREQLCEKKAGAAQFIDHGSRIGAGLERLHERNRQRHPIHLYRLRHIVVVKNQVFTVSPSTQRPLESVTVVGATTSGRCF